MTVATNQDPCLAGAPAIASTSTHQSHATTSWADMMEAASPLVPPLFDDLILEANRALRTQRATATPTLTSSTWTELRRRRTTPLFRSNCPDPLAPLTLYNR